MSVKRYEHYVDSDGGWEIGDAYSAMREEPDGDYIKAEDYDALAQLVCDLWHSSAAAHIPPGLQKRVRDAAYAQSVEEQRFPHGAPAVDSERIEIARRPRCGGVQNVD